MTDELARWAAERAPELRAQAEAEAVAVLRDALVGAALGKRKPGPAAKAQAARRRRAAPGNDLVWAYCVLPADAPTPAEAVGLDGSAPLGRVEAAGLAALVSNVPADEFGEDPLRENLNDLAWLERVARAHEAVLDDALASATIVPLRLCTLYESQQSVREMLAREREAFAHALEFLNGREEWAAKVLIDPERLAGEAQAAAKGDAEPSIPGAGGAYLLGRRREREVRQASAALAAQVAERVHSVLEDSALEAVKRPPQNRDLSGHEGEMVLNAAYLVEKDRVDELRSLASELEAEHARYGARVELTGPWPPYNFVPGGGTPTIA